MILLSTLRVIRFQICCINLSLLLNLNLTYETLWSRGGNNFFLISILEKLNFFHVIIPVTGAADVKKVGLSF